MIAFQTFQEFQWFQTVEDICVVQNNQPTPLILNSEIRLTVGTAETFGTYGTKPTEGRR
jgi:hypothetical protein